MSAIAIVLPALNEEDGIGKTIDGIKKTCDFKYTLYVVDGESTDNTVKIAKKKGAKIIISNELGKANAIRKAFGEIHEDTLILMDSDTSYDPADIPRVLSALKNCEICSGSRFRGKIEAGAMTRTNRLGNRLLTLLANILYSRNSSDMCTGMWGFCRGSYRQIKIDSNHFELEANFFVQAARKNLSYREVPISYNKRNGSSKLRMQDGLKIAAYLLKRSVRR